LCQWLLERGTEVVCLDNFLTGNPSNVAHLLPDPRFRLVRCDVTDFVHVRGDVDLVLHFASPASPADYLRLPIHTLKAGSLGTLHALGLAKEKQARFVLASTSEVYGDPLEHPQHEAYRGNVNPIGPRGVYDEAKRFAEALTTAYRKSLHLDTAIVRIFNTYGPRMRLDDGRAIPNFVRQSLLEEPITVTGAFASSYVRVGDPALVVEGHTRIAASAASVTPETSRSERFRARSLAPGQRPFRPAQRP
jgi:dTDP-glucose 4,6-dehydratase